MVLLPEPVAPTMPIVLPAGTSRLNLWSRGARPL